MASIAETMAGDHASARRLLDEAGAVTDGLDTSGSARGAPGPGAQRLLRRRSRRGQIRRRGRARLGRAAGDLYSLEMMLLNQGFAALIDGDPVSPGRCSQRHCGSPEQIDDRVAQFYMLGALGCHAGFRPAAAGRAAVRCGGAPSATKRAARTRCRSSPRRWPGPTAAPGARGHEVPGRVRGRKTAGPGRGAGARAGRSQGDGSAARPPGTAAARKREAEVARLVADGLTNKQIGARLFISERTVDSHVRSILNKLGFSSRAQIAAWMAAPDGV